MEKLELILFQNDQSAQKEVINFYNFFKQIGEDETTKSIFVTIQIFPVALIITNKHLYTSYVDGGQFIVSGKYPLVSITSFSYTIGVFTDDFSIVIANTNRSFSFSNIAKRSTVPLKEQLEKIVQRNAIIWEKLIRESEY